jgi:hypothetical protein
LSSWELDAGSDRRIGEAAIGEEIDYGPGGGIDPDIQPRRRLQAQWSRAAWRLRLTPLTSPPLTIIFQGDGNFIVKLVGYSDSKAFSNLLSTRSAPTKARSW